MNSYNQQNSQAYQNDQNGMDKQRIRSNPSHQYDSGNTKSFPKRDQINNSNFRNAHNSDFSNGTQDRGPQKIKPSYPNSGSSNLQDNNNNTGNRYQSNGRSNVGNQFVYSYPREQNNQQMNTSTDNQNYQNPQNNYNNGQEINRWNDNNPSQSLAYGNNTRNYGNNNQPNNMYGNQNSKFQQQNMQNHQNYQNQSTEQRNTQNGDTYSNSGPVLTKSRSDSHVTPENRRNDPSFAYSQNSDLPNNTFRRSNEFSSREKHQQSSKYPQTSPFNPENRNDLSRQYTQPKHNNYQKFQEERTNFKDQKHNQLEGRPSERKEGDSEGKSTMESENHTGKDFLPMKALEANAKASNQVFRIGEGLFIPDFFSNSASELRELPKLATQDLEGNLISNHDLLGLTINLTVKNYFEDNLVHKFSISLPNQSTIEDNPTKILPFKVDNLPTNASLQNSIKETIHTEATDIPLNLIQPNIQNMNDILNEDKKTQSRKALKSNKKPADVSSDSGDEETMFQNELAENGNSSLTLKQKLDKAKNRPEKNLEKPIGEKNKPTKLTFEIDLNPVAWIAEEEQPKKLLKTESAVLSGSTLEVDEENKLEEPGVQSSDKKKKIFSTTNPSSRPSSYKILGQDTTRYTRESNLFEKLENYLVEKEKTQTEIKEEVPINQQAQEATLAEDEAQKKLDEHYNFDNRYFINNPTKVCNRCKQPGHFERMCPESVKLLCLFCCKNHDMQDCEEIVCFRCSKKGHRSKDCREYDNITCFRCEKKGHKNVQCGIILPPRSHYADEKILREKRNSKHDGLCLMCGRFGHFNCSNLSLTNKDTTKIDDFYSTDDKIVEELKQELQKKNMNATNNASMFVYSQEDPDKESNDSVDSEDKKYLKRSGEKKNQLRKNSLNENNFKEFGQNLEGRRVKSDGQDNFPQNNQKRGGKRRDGNNDNYSQRWKQYPQPPKDS